jgi:hypothetical protein
MRSVKTPFARSWPEQREGARPASGGEDYKMFQAMIVCPKTGKAIPTGFTFGSLAAFDATTLTNNTLQCAVCGETHVVDNSTVKIFPQELS